MVVAGIAIFVAGFVIPGGGCSVAGWGSLAECKMPGETPGIWKRMGNHIPSYGLATGSRLRSNEL